MAVTLQAQQKTVPYVCAGSHFEHETGYSFMTFGLATNFHLREVSVAGWVRLFQRTLDLP